MKGCWGGHNEKKVLVPREKRKREVSLQTEYVVSAFANPREREQEECLGRKVDSKGKNSLTTSPGIA